MISYLKLLKSIGLRRFFLFFIIFFAGNLSAQNCTNNYNNGLAIDLGTSVLNTIPNIEDYALLDRQLELVVTCDDPTPIMVRFASPLPSNNPSFFSIVNTPQGKLAIKIILELLATPQADGSSYRLAPIGDISLSSVTATSAYLPVSGTQQVPSNPLSKFTVWTLVDSNNSNQIVSARQFRFPLKLRFLTADSSNGWRNELVSSGNNLTINFAALIVLSRL